MRLPTSNRGRALLVGGALMLAAGGASVATYQLTQGGAANTTLSERNGTLQGLVHTGAPHGHPAVPFLGPFALHPTRGQTRCGPAVRLMEGALRRKKFRHGPPRNCIGPATKKQIQAFQRSLHYAPNGVYNLATHQQMVRHGGYTNQARRDVIYLSVRVLHARERHNVLVISGHSVTVGGGNLAYCQSGERSYFPPWPLLPPCTDCSGFVTWIAYQAGFGASVGYYGSGSPVGWTGTLTVQGFLVRPNQPLQVGDIVLYPSSSARGPPWGHVEMYIGHGQTVGHGGVGVSIHAYNYRPVGEIRRLIA